MSKLVEGQRVRWNGARGRGEVFRILAVHSDGIRATVERIVAASASVDMAVTTTGPVVAMVTELEAIDE